MALWDVWGLRTWGDIGVLCEGYRDRYRDTEFRENETETERQRERERERNRNKTWLGGHYSARGSMTELSKQRC